MIIFDLDGTLADITHRVHFIRGEERDWDAFFRHCVDDKPIPAAIRTLAALYNAGHDMAIWTGRSNDVRMQTHQWLEMHVFPKLNPGRPPALVMRKHGDHTPDHILKKMWLDDEIRQGEEVELVFEDRDAVVKMWRDNSIPCFQVQPGDF